MGPFGRRAVTYDDVSYTPGSKFRVIGTGATLDGWVPELGASRGWRQLLRPGDLLTCTGYGPGLGGDPGYGVEFTSPESEAAGAFHCDVQPTTGGAFTSRPAAGLLEPADSEVRGA
jgi:hypothetical protein